MPTAYHIYNLTFAATLAQFQTAVGTTLPGAGASVIQAPIQFSGIVLFGNFTFTATTAIGTALTAVSAVNKLYVGLGVTAANVTPGATIGAVGPVNTATLANGAATTVVVGETFTALNAIGQIDFTYDGFGFIRFFGGAPSPAANPSGPGLLQNQMSNAMVQFLTNLFAPTLGAPVAANQANSFPVFVP